MKLGITPAPVRKSVYVNVPPDKAFAVFTAGMGRWWLKSHSINKGAPIADVVIEPFAGGRWYERGADGSTCTWGKVLAYEPPTRLLLAWQIDASWQHDPALTTEVEVRFIAADGGTRVELEHRHLERFGDKAESQRGVFDSPGGWSGLLQSYGELVSGEDR